MTDGFLFRTSRLETVAAQSNGDLKQDCQYQGGKWEQLPPFKILPEPRFIKIPSRGCPVNLVRSYHINRTALPPNPPNCLDLPLSLISTYLSHCQPADDS
jgi:hypothetical protein